MIKTVHSPSIQLNLWKFRRFLFVPRFLADSLADFFLLIHCVNNKPKPLDCLRLKILDAMVDHGIAAISLVFRIFYILYKVDQILNHKQLSLSHTKPDTQVPLLLNNLRLQRQRLFLIPVIRNHLGLPFSPECRNQALARPVSGISQIMGMQILHNEIHKTGSIGTAVLLLSEIIISSIAPGTGTVHLQHMIPVNQDPNGKLCDFPGILLCAGSGKITDQFPGIPQISILYIIKRDPSFLYQFCTFLAVLQTDVHLCLIMVRIHVTVSFFCPSAEVFIYRFFLLPGENFRVFVAVVLDVHFYPFSIKS